MAGPGIFPSPGYHISVQDRPCRSRTLSTSCPSVNIRSRLLRAPRPTTPLPPPSPTPGDFPSAGENVRVGLSLRNEIPRAPSPLSWKEMGGGVAAGPRIRLRVARQENQPGAAICKYKQRAKNGRRVCSWEIVYSSPFVFSLDAGLYRLTTTPCRRELLWTYSSSPPEEQQELDSSL